MAATLLALSLLAGVTLWILGLQLFLRSALSTPHKIVWTAVLVLVGATIGAILPGPSIRHKFLLLLVGLPVLAAVDLAFFRPARTLSFWLRACGYEVCTVFGVAGFVRFVLNRFAVYPLLHG